MNRFFHANGASSITFKGVTFQVKSNTVIASNAQLRSVMESTSSKGDGKEKDVMLEKGVEVLLQFGNYGDKNSEVKQYITGLIKVLDKNGYEI